MKISLPHEDHLLSASALGCGALALSMGLNAKQAHSFITSSSEKDTSRPALTCVEELPYKARRGGDLEREEKRSFR